MNFEGWKTSRQRQTASILSFVGVHEVMAEAGKVGDLPGLRQEGPNGVSLTARMDTMLMVGFHGCHVRQRDTLWGRVLIVPRGPAGPITLDFNQAMLPPHEFSAAVPYKRTLHENSLRFAVTAGEKKLINKR